MNEVNKIHHMNFLDNSIPDKSVQLIIADPPYYKVKGEFDFIWKTFDDYLKDVEKWAVECKRILADNGTLFWYGDAKNIAYSQVIFDKHFNLLNNIVWEKNECQTLRNEVAALRCFAPVTERILMYDKGEDQSGNERIFNDNTLFLPLKKYFDEWLNDANLTVTEAAKKIGSSCTHWLGFTKKDKVQFAIPTKDKYEKMGEIHPLKMSYEELRESYEELRESYEELRESYECLRRPFNLSKMQTDVFHFSQESHITKQYDHDTVKPLKLSRVLVQTCSRKGDLVCIPFAGSGTECEAAIIEGCKFVAFETEKKHVNTANKRVRPHLQQTTIFDQGA